MSKLHLLSNDKATAKDEIIISIFTLILFIIGITLVIVQPSFGFITYVHTAVAGAMMLLTSVMFIPCIIYRLITNYKEGEKHDK